MSLQKGNILIPGLLISLLVAAICLYLYLYSGINKFNIELTNNYTNDQTGFSFKYPKDGSVYKWFDTEENNLRVFTENNNQGYVCDIYVNSPQRKSPPSSAETVYYNGATWNKWQDKDNAGTIYDRHFTSWYSKNNNNWVVITGNIEIQDYCEKLTSTFKFTK